MTQSLAHSDELALAEAEAAAAQAEAAAARARADAAQANARLARLRTSHQVEAPEEPAQDKDTAPEPGTTDITAEESADARADTSVVAEKYRRRTRNARRRFRIRRLHLRWPTRRAALIAVMASITAAALVATGVIGWQHREAQTDASRAEAYVATAERGVTAITSLDFRHAKRDVDRIVSMSTGPFYDDFNKRAPDFTKVIEQSQVTTTGEVTATALESMTGDSAIILVSASSEVTNAAGAKQEPRVWRLRVTVTGNQGAMKISNVEFVP